MEKPSYLRAVIAPRGMGGFLNPPGHPEHTQGVESAAEGGLPQGERFAMSLSGASRDASLSPDFRARVRGILEQWEQTKLPLSAPEVQDWIRQCLGYFRACYRNPAAPLGQEWYASNVVIDSKRDPVGNADDHAGVHHIRGYYPEYNPTPADFAGAYWGARPQPPHAPITPEPSNT